MNRGAWILILILLSSCQAGRMIWYNFADIRDHRIFPARELKAGDANPFLFTEHFNSNKIPDSISFGGVKRSLDDLLDKSKTVAFLVVRNDTLLYEKYFDGYERSSMISIFSAAKSMTSALIGCAIADGFIGSVNDTITKYIPELHEEFNKVTIEHLLNMTSGLRFRESYLNPFSEVANFYYGTDLRKSIKKLRLKREPGGKFEYVSGNTQLLGFVLERALKNKSITDYFNEKLWGQMGMEFDGTWSIDSRSSGLEKTFCCVNARARDLAKFGRLYLNNGNWNGKQLVPEEWARESSTRDTLHPSYKYQWWMSRGDDKIYYAHGFLGQFIWVDPASKMIIVRLGKNYGNVYWNEVFRQLSK